MTVEQFMEETADLYGSAHVGKIYDIVSRKLDESTQYSLAHPKKVSGYEQYINKYPLELAHLLPGGEVKSGIEDYDLRVRYQNRITSIDRYIGRRRVDDGKTKRRTLKRSMYLDKQDDSTYVFNEKTLDPFYLGYKIVRNTWSKGSKVYSIDTNQPLFEADSIYDCIFQLPYIRLRTIENAKREFKQLYERGLINDPDAVESECYHAARLSYNDRDYALATCEKPGEQTYALCARRLYSYIELEVFESSEAANGEDYTVLADLLPYKRAKQLKVEVNENREILRTLRNCKSNYEHHKEMMERAAADAKEMEEALKAWNDKADDVLIETTNQYEELKKRLSQD